MPTLQCLICLTPDDARPGTESSDFAALFDFLIDGAADQWWLIDGDGHSPFPIRAEWFEGDGEAYDAFFDQFETIEGCESGMLAPSRVFAACCGDLNDFWLDVWLFPAGPATPLQFEQYVVDDLPQSVRVPAGCSHLFVNVDGCYWALITDDVDAIERVKRRWGNWTTRPVQKLEESG